MTDIIDAVITGTEEVVHNIEDVFSTADHVTAPVIKPFTMSFTEEGIKLLWKVLSVVITNPVHPFNAIETALITEIKDSIANGIGPVLQQMANDKKA